MAGGHVTSSADSLFHGEISWQMLVGACRRRWWWIALAACIGAIAAYLVAHQMTPSYRAETVLLFERPMVGSINPTEEQAPDTAERSWLIRSQMQILRSEKLEQEVINKLQLWNEPEFQPKADPAWVQLADASIDRVTDLVAPANQNIEPLLDPNAEAASEIDESPLRSIYDSRLDARQDMDTYILRLTFDATDPKLAARIANAHAEVYLDWLRQRRAEVVDDQARWLVREVDAQRAKLIAAEQAIQVFRTNSGLVDVSQGQTALDQRLAEMSTAVSAAEADYVAKRARQAELSRLRKAGATSTLSEALGSSLIQDLRQQEAKLSAELTQLRAEYGTRHPLTRSKQQEIDRLNQSIAIETQRMVSGIETDLTQSKARYEGLAAQLNSLKQDVIAAQGSRAELQRLEDERVAERTRYDELFAQLRSYERARDLARANASILSSAQPPSSPREPRVPLFAAVGFVLMAGVGTLAAILRELATGIVRGVRDAEAKSGLTCLAQLPEVRQRRGRLDRTGISYTWYIEGLRLIGASLARDIGANRTEGFALLVTSSLPAEGKSTFCREISRLAARSGIVTLLVNADPKDFRRTPGSTPQPVENEPGMFVVRLSLRDSMPSAQDLSETIEAFRREYGFIVIDTPPLAALSEAAVLAQAVDRVLVVARVDRTPSALLRTVVRQLSDAGGRVAGLVLTFARQNRGSLSRGDFAYYYRHNKKYYDERRVPSLTKA